VNLTLVWPYYFMDIACTQGPRVNGAERSIRVVLTSTCQDVI